MGEYDVQNDKTDTDKKRRAGYHDTRDSYGLDWVLGDGSHHSDHSPMSKLAHFVIILISLFVSIDGYYLFIKYSQNRTLSEISANVNDTYLWFSDIYSYMDNISILQTSKFDEQENKTLDLIYNCGTNLSYINNDGCQNLNYNVSPVVTSIYNNLIQNPSTKIMKVEVYNKFFTYLNSISNNGGARNSSSLLMRNKAVNIVNFNTQPTGDDEFNVINELEYKQDRANFYSANGMTLSSLGDIYNSNKVMFGVVRAYDFGTGVVSDSHSHVVRAVHPVTYKNEAIYYVVFYIAVDDILSELTSNKLWFPAVVLNSAGYVIASNYNHTQSNGLSGDRMYDLAELSYAVKYSDDWRYMLAHKSGKISSHSLTGTYFVFSPYDELPQDYIAEQEKYWVVYSDIDANYYIAIAVFVFIFTYIFIATLFGVFTKKHKN